MHNIHHKQSRVCVPLLGVCVVALTLGYIGSLSATLWFAHARVAHVQETKRLEGEVAVLEQQFFKETKRIHAIDYKELGFVVPRDIRYVSKSGDPLLTARAQ